MHNLLKSKKYGKIFLIGGGEIIKRETIEIDRDIIKAGGGKNSRVLFFPTAANDSNKYIKNFVKYYSFLGCNNILWTKLSQASTRQTTEKMDWATIIYLGGGKTERLIELFKEKKLVNHLRNRLEKDVVLVGMSAGAMALGEISIVSEINEGLKFAPGFIILPDIICLAHYQKQNHNTLKQIKEKFPKKIVLGIPEKAAVYLRDQKIKYYNQCFRL